MTTPEMDGAAAGTALGGPPAGTTPTVAHGVAEARGLFDREILGRALIDAFKKLDPRVQVRNPVMFVVLVGTVITFIEAIAHPSLFAWSSPAGCS